MSQLFERDKQAQGGFAGRGGVAVYARLVVGIQVGLGLALVPVAIGQALGAQVGGNVAEVRHEGGELFLEAGKLAGAGADDVQHDAVEAHADGRGEFGAAADAPQPSFAADAPLSVGDTDKGGQDGGKNRHSPWTVAAIVFAVQILTAMYMHSRFTWALYFHERQIEDLRAENSRLRRMQDVGQSIGA
jgi:hypothetical protein